MTTGADLSRPVLIGGASSSGTTLLAAVLNRHPRLLCGPELSCFDKAVLYEQDWASVQRRLRWNVQRRLEIFDVRWKRPLFDSLEETGISRRELARMAARAGSYRGWLDAFAARYLALGGKARWVEKTPTNIYCVSQFLDLYPGGKCIQVVRDGRDCLISQVRRGRSLYFSAWIWLCAAAAGARLRDDPRVLTVKYETLVARPRETLEEICAFLEESHDESLLVPSSSEQGNFHATWTSHPGQPINSKSVGRYRELLDRETERIFFSFALTPQARERYQAPFTTVPEALAYWGYETHRASYPEARLQYTLRQPSHPLLKRLRRRLRGKQTPDHMPQEMFTWCGAC